MVSFLPFPLSLLSLSLLATFFPLVFFCVEFFCQCFFFYLVPLGIDLRINVRGDWIFFASSFFCQSFFLVRLSPLDEFENGASGGTVLYMAGTEFVWTFVVFLIGAYVFLVLPFYIQFGYSHSRVLEVSDAMVDMQLVLHKLMTNVTRCAKENRVTDVDKMVSLYLAESKQFVVRAAVYVHPCVHDAVEAIEGLTECIERMRPSGGHNDEIAACVTEAEAVESQLICANYLTREFLLDLYVMCAALKYVGIVIPVLIAVAPPRLTAAALDLLSI